MSWRQNRNRLDVDHGLRVGLCSRTTDLRSSILPFPWQSWFMTLVLHLRLNLELLNSHRSVLLYRPQISGGRQSCHLQKYWDDSAVVGCIKETGCRKLVDCCVAWCVHWDLWTKEMNIFMKGFCNYFHHGKGSGPDGGLEISLCSPKIILYDCRPNAETKQAAARL